jgi:hypothetical protein
MKPNVYAVRMELISGRIFTAFFQCLFQHFLRWWWRGQNLFQSVLEFDAVQSQIFCGFRHGINRAQVKMPRQKFWQNFNVAPLSIRRIISKIAAQIMKREYKKLIYKQVDGFSNGENLQDALHEALVRYALPAKRVEPLGADGSQVRFINVHRKHQNLIVGIFHRLTKGAGQYVISMPDSGQDWPVQLVTADKSDSNEKTQREFVEGTLFFALWKNHLVMHQSNACRAEQIQSYFSWLLSREQPKQYLVGFSDPLPPDLRKKSRQPVTSIKFGSSFTTVSAAPVGTAKKARVRFKPVGEVWDGLVSILRAVKADIPEIDLDDALAEQDIRVDLELSCSKKKSQSTAGEVLGVLGRSLSHSDADAFEVSLADGTKIRAEQMKVETDVRVECVQKQPVPEELFKSMVEWMQQLVDNKTIIEREAFGNA